MSVVALPAVDGSEVSVAIPSDPNQFLAEIKQVAETEVFKGYPIADLRVAFEQIEDKENWKNPIFGYIRAADLQKYQAAAEFFAGSSLQIVEFVQNGFASVKGPGYYQSVGA